MRLYAVDIGFGWTKYCYGDLESDGLVRVVKGKFPTVLAYVNEGVRLDDAPPVAEHVWGDEKVKLIVGEDAVSAGSGFGVRDIDTLIKYMPVLLAEVLRRTGWRGDDVALAVGLAPADVRSYGPVVKGVLMQGVPVTGCGFCKPERVEVYPQCVSIKAEIDLDGGQRMQRGLILDVGHNTLDVVAITNGRVLAGDVHTENNGGIARAVGVFCEFARFQHQVTFSTLQEAYEAMMRREFWSRGKRIDCSQEVDRCLRGYVSWLIAKLRERWDERLSVSQRLVLVGGGAGVVMPYFPDDLVGMVHVLREPEFANASAYMLLLSKHYGGRLVFER